jgi:hypothetical protein
MGVLPVSLAGKSAVSSKVSERRESLEPFCQSSIQHMGPDKLTHEIGYVLPNIRNIYAALLRYVFKRIL